MMENMVFNILKSIYEAYNSEGWNDSSDFGDLELASSMSKNLSRKMVYGSSLIFDLEVPENIPSDWNKNIPSFLNWLNGPDGQKYWASFCAYMQKPGVLGDKIKRTSERSWSNSWDNLISIENGKYFSETSCLRILWMLFEFFMIFLNTTFFIGDKNISTKADVMNILYKSFGKDIDLLYFNNRVDNMPDLKYIDSNPVKIKDIMSSYRNVELFQYDNMIKRINLWYQFVLGLIEDIYKHVTGDYYNRNHSAYHAFIYQILDWFEDMSGITGPDFLELIDMDDFPPENNCYLNNCIPSMYNNMVKWFMDYFPE